MTNKNQMHKRYPKVKCSRCGDCCRIPIVPITHKDLSRLVKLTGKPAHELVRFCPTAEMDYDGDSGLWIRFKREKRAMVLRKRRNRCIFQSTGRACAVYAARPQTCRTFPYNITLDDDGEVDEIRLNKVMPCNAVRCKGVDIDAIIVEVKKENREDAEYHRLIKKWNRLDDAKRGGVKDFLAFLGF